MNRHLLIFLDKSLFQIIFYLVVLLSRLWGKKPEYNPRLDGSESFLVIRPGGLGDGLMSIPLLRALRKNFPDNKITLLCVQKNKAALRDLPFFDELVVIDSLSSFHKNILKLFAYKFDVVFDLEPFRKVSSVIANLSGANIRIGFDTNNRRLLYTHYVTYANEKCYESLNMIRQLKVLGVDVPQNEAMDITFPLADGAFKKAHALLRSNGLSPDKDFVVAIVPGVLKNHHRWIMSRFAELISLILKDDGKTKIILLGSTADVTDAHEVLHHTKERAKVINLVGETNFIEALGILKACKILIACDGGTVYMAAAMGCATISIWGPGVMDRFKPPGENHIGLRKDYFCIPCVNYSRLGEFPKCRYDRRCIKDISSQEVFDKYMDLKSRIMNKTNMTPAEWPNRRESSL